MNSQQSKESTTAAAEATRRDEVWELRIEILKVNTKKEVTLALALAFVANQNTESWFELKSI